MLPIERHRTAWVLLGSLCVCAGGCDPFYIYVDAPRELTSATQREFILEADGGRSVRLTANGGTFAITRQEQTSDQCIQNYNGRRFLQRKGRLSLNSRSVQLNAELFRSADCSGIPILNDIYEVSQTGLGSGGSGGAGGSGGNGGGSGGNGGGSGGNGGGSGGSGGNGGGA